MKIDKRKLDLCRARKCITVQDLAKEAGVSCRAISKDAPIGAVPVGKIAAALGVDPEEIVVDEERG